MSAVHDHRIVPVLLYHHVVPGRPETPWEISIDALRRHLELLADTQASTLRATDFARRCRIGTLPPGPLAMITFDDAHAGVLELALPLLTELNLVASFFVTTDMLGAGPNLSPQALHGFADKHLEIGSHTVSHPQLDVMNRTGAWNELIWSRERLERLVVEPVTALSYPHGYYGQRVRELAMRAGYETAHAVKNAFSFVGDDLFAVARLTVLATTPDEEVARWVAHRGAKISQQSEAAQTVLWRQYRRVRRLGPRPRVGRSDGSCG